MLVTWLLLAVLRGRLHPVGGLGVALGVTVLLFPVVQPWYLLWAIIPLAAWATRPGFRGTAIALTLVVGIFGPTANGDRFALFQIVDATLASLVIVVILIALTYSRLPWRPLPDTNGAAETEPPAGSVRPRPPHRGRRPPSPTPTLSPRDLPFRRPARAQALVGRPVRCAGSVSGTGRRRPSTGSTSTSAAPRCSRCSVRTARARPRRWRCARGSCGPTPAPSRSSGSTRSTNNAALRERIGVMLQGGGGYPAARAGEMLNLVAAYSANPLDPQWLMDTLGLTEAARTTYRRLSGGQQQRLALACAVVGRPELVFLDEPTAGMDAHARIVVWELIDGLRRDGVTVVLTTHQLTEAEQLADRLVIIDHGVAVATGTPAELMRGGAENQLRFTAPPDTRPDAARIGAARELHADRGARRASTSSRAGSTRRCWPPSPRGVPGSTCWPPTCASSSAASRTSSST